MRGSQFLALTALSAVAVGGGLPAIASEEDPGAGGMPDVNASILWVDTEFAAEVVVPWEDGGSTSYTTEVMAYCTGFFVSEDGDIATAGHCVEPDRETEIIALDNVLADLAAEGYDVSGLVPSDLDWQVTFADAWAVVGQPSGVKDGILSGEKGMTAQVVDVQSFGKGDNALLRVADLDGTPGLPMATETPEVGQEVVSVGFPGSVSRVSDVQRQLPSYKFGTVSSRQYTELGVPNTEIDAAVTGGMSGGPTLDDQGTVIGVNSFGVEGESQPFNFVTDTETLRDFLARNGVDVTVAGATSDVELTRSGEGPVATTVGGGSPEATGSVATGTAAQVPAAQGSSTGGPGGDGGGLMWVLGGLAATFLVLAGALAGRAASRAARTA